MKAHAQSEMYRSIAGYGVRELDITLVRPTNYTDDGYPIQTHIGVIRSNTLTQMGTLTRDLVHYPFFKDVQLTVRMIDEAVQRVPKKEILHRSKLSGVRSIVMLVGVQSNQFPRAQDIASWFLPAGIPVLIGGFHVSGMLSMIGLTAELRAALCRGMILVAGEVEGNRLPAIIEDVIRGQAEPLYNYLNPTVDLSNLPIPRFSRDDFRHFASPYTTIETGRGCVFTCDFCTIINIQGRTMRCRDPRQIVDFARQNYRDAGVKHSFFTDDNLARNPRWRELFDGLINLREKEHIPFTFMMQSDLAARKMPPGDFFARAARAGCNQVFFGVESVNRENLRAQGKFQNQVTEYRDLVDHCHNYGITCHAGYILGFPFDTRESIRDNIGELQQMGFDAASFYILAPLPGSKDHQNWWRERRWMESDLNTYDSAHVAVLPERMTRDELMQAYRDAWDQFYSVDYTVTVLKKVLQNNPKDYWGRLFFGAAYLYAARVEGLHPMNCGFWTLRHRNDRRSTFRREALIPFWWNYFRLSVHKVAGLISLFFQLEEIWLRSRPKGQIEETLYELIAATKQDWEDSAHRVIDWREIKVKELRELYRMAKDRLPELDIPSPAALWFKKHNPFIGVYTRSYFQRTWSKWYLYFWNPFKWAELSMFELFNGMKFLRHLLTEGR